MGLGKTLTLAARESTKLRNSPTVKAVDNVIKKHGAAKPAAATAAGAAAIGSGNALLDKLHQRSEETRIDNARKAQERARKNRPAPNFFLKESACHLSTQLPKQTTQENTMNTPTLAFLSGYLAKEAYDTVGDYLDDEKNKNPNSLLFHAATDSGTLEALGEATGKEQDFNVNRPLTSDMLNAAGGAVGGTALGALLGYGANAAVRDGLGVKTGTSDEDAALTGAGIGGLGGGLLATLLNRSSRNNKIKAQRDSKIDKDVVQQLINNHAQRDKGTQAIGGLFSPYGYNSRERMRTLIALLKGKRPVGGDTRTAETVTGLASALPAVGPAVTLGRAGHGMYSAADAVDLAKANKSVVTAGA